jgi:hypothetical protein
MPFQWARLFYFGWTSLENTISDDAEEAEGGCLQQQQQKQQQQQGPLGLLKAVVSGLTKVDPCEQWDLEQALCCLTKKKMGAGDVPMFEAWGQIIKEQQMGHVLSKVTKYYR